MFDEPQYLDGKFRMMDPLKKIFLIVHYDIIAQWVQAEEEERVPSSLVEFQKLRKKVMGCFNVEMKEVRVVNEFLEQLMKLQHMVNPPVEQSHLLSSFGKEVCNRQGVFQIHIDSELYNNMQMFPQFQCYQHLIAVNSIVLYSPFSSNLTKTILELQAYQVVNLNIDNFIKQLFSSLSEDTLNKITTFIKHICPQPTQNIFTDNQVQISRNTLGNKDKLIYKLKGLQDNIQLSKKQLELYLLTFKVQHFQYIYQSDAHYDLFHKKLNKLILETNIQNCEVQDVQNESQLNSIYCYDIEEDKKIIVKLFGQVFKETYKKLEKYQQIVQTKIQLNKTVLMFQEWLRYESKSYVSIQKDKVQIIYESKSIQLVGYDYYVNNLEQCIINNFQNEQKEIRYIYQIEDEFVYQILIKKNVENVRMVMNKYVNIDANEQKINLLFKGDYNQVHIDYFFPFQRNKFIEKMDLLIKTIEKNIRSGIVSLKLNEFDYISNSLIKKFVEEQYIVQIDSDSYLENKKIQKMKVKKLECMIRNQNIKQYYNLNNNLEIFFLLQIDVKNHENIDCVIEQNPNNKLSNKIGDYQKITQKINYKKIKNLQKDHILLNNNIVNFYDLAFNFLIKERNIHNYQSISIQYQNDFESFLAFFNQISLYYKQIKESDCKVKKQLFIIIDNQDLIQYNYINNLINKHDDESYRTVIYDQRDIKKNILSQQQSLDNKTDNKAQIRVRGTQKQIQLAVKYIELELKKYKEK